jgi:uncharacterized protein with LGFP repeats
MNHRSTLNALAFITLATLAGTGCSQPADAGDESQESDFTNCVIGPGVSGPIEAKYRELGACLSFLGPPVHGVRTTPDGKGQYAAFFNGSIYYREDLGAHVVRGEIRELWKAFDWEAGPLGYPTSDETVLDDGGRYSVFEGGSVYWSFATGAHEVRGAIRDEWAKRGWERGALGYPVTGEIEVPGGIRSNFQGGSITWKRDGGHIAVALDR